MRVVATLDTLHPPEAVYAALEDLAIAPEWLAIVPRAEATESSAGDPGPAWKVDLRARVGPLARSKRLRMVRTVAEAPHRLHFDRREIDGRPHGRWHLGADIEPTPTGSRLRMELEYEGRFATGLLDRLLADEVERSRPRLVRLLDERAAPS